MTAFRVVKWLLPFVLLPLGIAGAQERVTTGFVIRMPFPAMPVPIPLPGPGADRPALVGHGLSVTRRGVPMAQPGRAGLLMECRNGEVGLLALDLDWPPGSEPVGEVDVTVQIDQASMPERWRILGNAYAPPDAAALIERFRTARTFVLQVRTAAGEREVSFDLRDFAEAADRIGLGCPY